MKKTLIALTTIFILTAATFAGAINIKTQKNEKNSIKSEISDDIIYTSKCWRTLTITGDTVASAAFAVQFYDYIWDNYRNQWTYKLRLTGVYSGEEYANYPFYGKNMMAKVYHTKGVNGGGVMAKGGMNIQDADGPNDWANSPATIWEELLKALSVVSRFAYAAEEIAEKTMSYTKNPDVTDDFYIKQYNRYASCYFEYDFTVPPNTEFQIEFDLAVEFLDINLEYKLIELSKNNEKDCQGTFHGDGRIILTGVSPMSADDDKTNPSVYFLKPKEKKLYINDKEIVTPFPIPIIIGDIDIVADACDSQTGISRVNFYIEDLENKKYTDYDCLYYWNWNERDMGVRDVIMEAVDRAGNSKFLNMTVFYYNPFGEDPDVDVTPPSSFNDNSLWTVTVDTKFRKDDIINIESEINDFTKTNINFTYVTDWGDGNIEVVHKEDPFYLGQHLYDKNCNKKISIEVTASLFIDIDNDGVFDGENEVFEFVSKTEYNKNKIGKFFSFDFLQRFFDALGVFKIIKHLL